MATKSFKDICVEYASQLGKGLPLTPAEMCNAVIMYLNQQVDTMNQAISDFEDEIGDPKYIAKLNVNNDFTQDNSFNLSADAHIFTVKKRLNLDPGEVYINNSNNCVQFQSKNGTLALTSDIPDIPVPTTYDNGKVIGVENGEYALVEQSTSTNTVTTNTQQTIMGRKIFQVPIEVHTIYNVYNSIIYESYSTLTGSNHVVGNPKSDIIIKGKQEHLQYNDNTIANVSDIPNLDNYDENIDIINGTSGNGISVHDTTNTSPYTKYGYDKIETYGNSNALQYTLNIPNKNGTIATLDDIPTTVTKYFTRVICNDTNTNTLYIFSCITEGDLSGNNVYGDVVSLLTELGAINPTTALPCSGKTSAGGAVIGVYTDGSAITVFGGDNATEEIPTSAEINVISK